MIAKPHMERGGKPVKKINPSAEDSAQNDLPAHCDIFFIRTLKQKIPQRVHGCGKEKQNKGGNWHGLFHEFDQFLIHFFAGIMLNPMRGLVKEGQFALVAQVNGWLCHFRTERNITFAPQHHRRDMHPPRR